MRLRRVDICHWRCIESLSLTDLPDGVTILYGPNRTGKSSLVQAVRSCLFDHFHDSQDAIMTGAVPRRSQATPQVIVEWEQAGQRYRLAKTFSPRKEGQATLEQQSGAGWTVLDRGKEATRRARALLGVEKSEAGLFQLLWLHQGEVHLPKPKEVDAQLAEAIESVLRSLITGRDLDFKHKLDRACERWFTVKTMKDRKDSPLTRLAKEQEHARAAQQEIDQQLAVVEDALRLYEAARSRHPQWERDFADAEAELTQVQTQWDAIKERQHQHELAVQKRDQAKTDADRAQSRANEFQETQRKSQEEARQLAELQEQHTAAGATRDSNRKTLTEAEAKVPTAEGDLQEHQRGQADLDDRQELLTLATQQVQLKGTLDRVRELVGRRQDLESKLAGPPAPSAEELETLATNRRKATELKAQLEAGEIHLGVHADQGLTVEAVIDDLPAETIALNQGQSCERVARQRARLQWEAIGRLVIARGAADQNLEQAAQRLSQLEKAFRNALASFGVGPSDPTALDQLSRRKLEREHWSKDLKAAMSEIHGQAPHGLAALEREAATLDRRRNLILQRHADWADWTPVQGDIDSFKTAFAARGQQLSAAVQSAKAALELCRTAHTQADESVQQLTNQVTAKKVALDMLQTQKTKLGSEEVLARSLTEARIAMQTAEDQVKATALTEAEQTIHERYRAAQDARKLRDDRLRKNELDLRGLEVQLRGSEGLHQKRVHAEQALNETSRERQRQELSAGAHRHLKELFDQVRQEQVRRTVGPISERVLNWAHHIGLEDYADLAFADQLLPQGLIPHGAASGDEPVDLQEESYGTVEQLGVLVRLAVGGLLAKDEPAVAVLDDPLVHADPVKHRRMLDILERTTHGGDVQGGLLAGPLQLLILTCHPERFDHLPGARHYNLGELIKREP